MDIKSILISIGVAQMIWCQVLAIVQVACECQEAVGSFLIDILLCFNRESDEPILEHVDNSQENLFVELQAVNGNVATFL